MKSILFLGGGPLGLPNIKWAKEIGFNIIVNDRNMNAPGFKHADISIFFDSTDIRRLSTWVLNNNASLNIRYCYCGSDFGLLTAAVIHEILDIPHASITAIINGLDKGLMKTSWNKTEGVNYPLSLIVNKEQDIIEAGKQLGWPLIIKPTSSSGSQGVSLANDKNDATMCFQEAAKYSSTGQIIAEQFIEGTHHDINGLFWNDTFYPCGIGDRFFTPFPYCVPHHGYFPSALAASKKQELYRMLENGARSMGIFWGPVKADSVINNGDCYIYEISPRFHGDIVTSNSMSMLEDRNPIFQLLINLYNESEFIFYPIEGKINFVGGWRTIFKKAELINLEKKQVNIWQKNEKEAVIVKNNSDIYGLAWGWGKNYKEVFNKLII